MEAIELEGFIMEVFKVTKKILTLRMGEQVRKHHGEYIPDVRLLTAVENVFDIMRVWLCDGKRITIRGWGTLYSRYKEGGRPVRNPKTGETFTMRDTVTIRHGLHMATVKANGTKSERISEKMLIKALADRMALRNEVAETLIHVVMDAIRESVQPDVVLEIRGFGTFTSIQKPDRKYRNPQTGEAVVVPAHLRPHFKQSKLMRQYMECNWRGDTPMPHGNTAVATVENDEAKPYHSRAKYQ